MRKRTKRKQSSAKSKSAAKYTRGLSSFARKLLREWKSLHLSGHSIVIVAVSGGADSVALLLALSELVRAGKTEIGIVVAHLNHKLRGSESDADARWVAGLAKQLGHPGVVACADIKRRAAKLNENLEQTARRFRYEFLGKAARSHEARLIVTAHTMNDQAETVLINMIRGSGGAGLGGIDPLRPLTADSKIFLARPLLSWARRQ